MSHLVCRRNIFDGEVGEVISVAPCGSSSLLHQVPERNSSEGERSVRLMFSEAQSVVISFQSLEPEDKERNCVPHCDWDGVGQMDR